MKNTVKKGFALASTKVMTAVAATQLAMLKAYTSMTAFAEGTTTNNPDVNLEKVTEPIIGLVNQVLNVLIPLVAAVGALFCISLGIKYARAEEPQEREKAKQHLKNAIIGFVLIFVLIVALRLSAEPLTNWMNSAS